MENNKIFHYIKMEEIENNEKINNEEKNQNTKIEENKSNDIKVFNLINIPGPSNNCIDFTLIIVSFSSIAFGIVSMVIINNITGIGYIGMGIFSGVSLFTVKRMRLRATIQKSVNILQQENDELKENNDELKENVGDLEHNVEELEENLLTFKTLEKNLREDINTLKKVVGLVGDNSSDAIKELKIILKNLSEENKKHEFLVKNQIISYLYQNKDKIDNFKEFLIELYKDISWNEIVSKIKLESL
jgi:FtsZ-binding cell division protein ZapB